MARVLREVPDFPGDKRVVHIPGASFAPTLGVGETEAFTQFETVIERHRTLPFAAIQVIHKRPDQFCRVFRILVGIHGEGAVGDLFLTKREERLCIDSFLSSVLKNGI